MSPGPDFDLLEPAVEALGRSMGDHYPEGVIGALSEALGAEANALALARAALEPARILALMGREPQVATALSTLRQEGGRGRGGQLARNAIVSGWGETDAGQVALISAGLLVLVPAPGLRQWSMSEVLEGRQHLQRELVCPKATLAWIEAVAPASAPTRSFELDGARVSPEQAGTMELLELDLLHLFAQLDGDALALNKDSSPNRRSLQRHARALSVVRGRFDDPQGVVEAEVVEPIYHLLTLGMSLGIFVLAGGGLTADHGAGAAFFALPVQARDRALIKAWRSCEGWLEDEILDALERVPPAERRHPLDRTSEVKRLSAVRGQLITDLLSLSLEGWSDLERVATALMALDRGFLAESLQGISDPARFVRGVLSVALPWMGIARLGRDEAGRRAFAWTARGRRALEGRPPPEREVPSPPPLVVQPNLEVTLFLDSAEAKDLFTLYQVGARVSLSEHTAVFQMDALTLQRAYGRGQDAEALLAFLKERSRTPVPEPVAFTVRDWQRVQRRLTLYATGALLLLPDPNRLDAVVDNIRYALPEQAQVLRLGLEAAFLPGGDDKALGKLQNLKGVHRVHYDRSPPACFEARADLRLVPLAVGLDIIAQVELGRIAEPAEGGGFDLSAKKLRERWGDGAVESLLSFLRSRIEGDVTAAVELRARALLGEVSAEVRRGQTVLTFSDAAAVDRLLEIHGIEEMLGGRLGPTALWVAPGFEEALERRLGELGLVDAGGAK